MKKTIIKVVIAAMAVVLTFGMCIGFAACSGTKTVTVGYTLYPPMNYEDDNGNLVGFDTELATKVFEELGYKVVFKEIEWNKKYTDLNAGTIDCIWNGFTSNGNDDGTPRSELVDFSYNYMKNYQAVVVKASEIAKYTDKNTSFVGKKGYVEQGSAGQEYAGAFTDAIVEVATTQMSAVMQVKSSAADFAVVDYLLANSVVGKGDYSDLAFVENLNSEIEYYGIGFKKGSELTAKVNALLEKYAEDGSLAELATKYQLSNAVILDYSSQK